MSSDKALQLQEIAIFKNRVEIRSPGGLYDGLTMEEMRGGNV